VAQECNPRYLEGWDQNNHSLKRALPKILWELISKEKSWAWWCAPGMPRPWVESPELQKEKNSGKIALCMMSVL
jgi:hypothetical protein